MVAGVIARGKPDVWPGPAVAVAMPVSSESVTVAESVDCCIIRPVGNQLDDTVVGDWESAPGSEDAEVIGGGVVAMGSVISVADGSTVAVETTADVAINGSDVDEVSGTADVAINGSDVDEVSGTADAFVVAVSEKLADWVDNSLTIVLTVDEGATTADVAIDSDVGGVNRTSVDGVITASEVDGVILSLAISLDDTSGAGTVATLDVAGSVEVPIIVSEDKVVPGVNIGVIEVSADGVISVDVDEKVVAVSAIEDVNNVVVGVAVAMDEVEVGVLDVSGKGFVLTIEVRASLVDISVGTELVTDCGSVVGIGE